jgi:O-succinylhomoserine sulfhydrylase
MQESENHPAQSEHFETIAVRTQAPRSPEGEHSTAIHMTSSYIFPDAEEARARFAGESEGNIYSRYSNPTNDELIKKLTLLEEMEDGVVTASGMSAMFLSLAAFLKQGDHLVSCRSIFGSTHQVITQILSRWGVEHTYVDVAKPQEWAAAFRPNTKVLYLETPTNPRLDIVDLAWAGELAREKGVKFVVDNCFATPYLQVPRRFGADLVAHSTTKFIDGQGRTIGGAVLGTKEAIEEVRFLARHTGPAMSPFNGWVLTKSLETLAVRMDRHCQSALALAQHLESHKEIQWVRYPFLPSHPMHEVAKRQMRHGGGLVTFEVKGGVQRGRKFLDALEMLSLTANLGDTRSTVTHPASTTHSKLSEEERLEVGITPGLIRISVGLENLSDILADVEQALRHS